MVLGHVSRGVQARKTSGIGSSGGSRERKNGSKLRHGKALLCDLHLDNLSSILYATIVGASLVTSIQSFGEIALAGIVGDAATPDGLSV